MCRCSSWGRHCETRDLWEVNGVQVVPHVHRGRHFRALNSPVSTLESDLVFLDGLPKYLPNQTCPEKSQRNPSGLLQRDLSTVQMHVCRVLARHITSPICHCKTGVHHGDSSSPRRIQQKRLSLSPTPDEVAGPEGFQVILLLPTYALLSRTHVWSGMPGIPSFSSRSRLFIPTGCRFPPMAAFVHEIQKRSMFGSRLDSHFQHDTVPLPKSSRFSIRRFTCRRDGGNTVVILDPQSGDPRLAIDASME